MNKIALTTDLLAKLGFIHVQKDWTDDSYYMIDYWYRNTFFLYDNTTHMTHEGRRLETVEDLQSAYREAIGEDLPQIVE